MKTVSIEIRPGEPQEASAIADVHRVSWLQTYGGLIPHRPLVQMVNRRDETWWRKATRGPATLLVVDVAGTIAGYATLGLSRAKALPQEGEIYEIYLRPEYQGIGLGRILFGEARACCVRSTVVASSSGASKTASMPTSSSRVPAAPISPKAWKISATST